jgi:hypothetical protein
VPRTGSTGIRWVRPPESLARAIEQYGDRVIIAVTALAGRIATIMQNDARESATWTDRTGNARTGLFGTAERDAAQKMVVIYLSHGADIDYGKWLELANGGKYAVVMRTIESHLPELKAELDALFR